MWLKNNPVCPVKFFLPPKEQDPVFNLDSLRCHGGNGSVGCKNRRSCSSEGGCGNGGSGGYGTLVSREMG